MQNVSYGDMSDTPDTFTDLIEAIGGAQKLAALIEVTDLHARTMKQRASIEPEYWPALISGVRKFGIKLDMNSLVAMRRNGKALRNAKRKAKGGVAA